MVCHQPSTESFKKRIHRCNPKELQNYVFSTEHPIGSLLKKVYHFIVLRQLPRAIYHKEERIMKKMLALLLALIMVMSMTACNPESNVDETRATLSIPQEVLDTPSRVNADFYPLKTDTVLRVLFTEDGLGATDASRLWEETTGVKTENLTWTNEQMFTCLAAGDIPDAIVMPWHFDKSSVYEFGSAGKFLDFKQHLSKMPNLCALIREHPEILEVCAYPDGGMYSLPKVGWNNTYQSNLMYIRTDMLEELGWSKVPSTTDELLQFVKEAQAKYRATNPDFIAFMPQNNTYMHWSNMNTLASTLFPSFGELVETGLTLNKNNEVVLGAATEQYRLYLEYMNELWNSGGFATEIYTMDSVASRAAIQKGNCAVSVGTYAAKQAFSDGVVDVQILEPLTSKYQTTKQWMKIPEVTYRACVANANCKDLDTLLAWLDSFYAPYTNPLNKEGTVFGDSIFKGKLDKNWEIDHEAKNFGDLAKFTNYYDFLTASVVCNYVPDEKADLHLKATQTLQYLLPYAKEVSSLSDLVLSADEQDNYSDLWADLEK